LCLETKTKKIERKKKKKKRKKKKERKEKEKEGRTSQRSAFLSWNHLAEAYPIFFLFLFDPPGL
jgi:hypothetical protein